MKKETRPIRVLVLYLIDEGWSYEEIVRQYEEFKKMPTPTEKNELQQHNISKSFLSYFEDYKEEFKEAFENMKEL